MLTGGSEVSVIIFTLTIELGLTGLAENTPLKIYQIIACKQKYPAILMKVTT